MKDVILGRNKIIDEPNPFPYDQFYDTRPLTEETLKELNIQLEKPICDYIEYYETNDGETSTLELNGIGGQRPKFKTVGKLKMLIEALKGDE